jgi:hypothetical protein
MNDQARLMAERIARRVSGDTSSDQPRARVNTDIASELAAMRASLSELQSRLVQIESKVTAGSVSVDSRSPGRVHSPWLAGVNAEHTSQERFGVEEATVSELVDFFQSEKTCSLEPGGKPCDHCAMCSSRGF